MISGTKSGMKHCLLASLVFAGTFPFAFAQQSETEIIQNGNNAGLKIAGKVAFTEGPAWHAATKCVFFTDVENNRIMRRDVSGKIHTFRTPSGRANGLTFDKEGRLHACEGGREGGNFRVTRTELNGTITVLTSDFEGKKYNSPNDLVIDSQGRIYFTDPRYGSRDNMQILDEDGKEIEGVYRIDPDGTVAQILTHEIDRPNGIVVSSDEKHLFVADNSNGKPGANRKLWRFDLKVDGSVDPASRILLFDWGNERGPDGMCQGKNGNLYVTAGLNFPNAHIETATKYKAGVYVIDPNGDGLAQFIPIPMDMITNCTFGGDEGRTLYITAGHTLWSIEIE